MKLLTLSTVIGSMLCGSLALAKPGQLDMNEFNSIINENQSIQKQLQTELQKNAGVEKTDLSKRGFSNRVIEKESSPVENVAVSSDLSFSKGKTIELKNDKKIMKRVSEEVNSAYSNE